MELAKLLLALSCILALGAATAGAPPPGQPTDPDRLASDFEAALKGVRAAKASHRIGLGDLEGPAERLARGRGPAAAGWLAEQALARRGRAATELALLTLANLRGRDAATRALLELAAKPEKISTRLVIAAGSYLPSDEARAFAQAAVDAAKSGEVRGIAAELLGVLGDEGSLRTLRALRERDRNTYVWAASQRGIALLEHRLGMRADRTRAEWDRQQLIYWRAQQDMPVLRSRTAGVFVRAATLAGRNVRFSPAFLKYHVAAGDAFAIALAGAQRERGLLEGLAPHLENGGYLGEIAREATAMMGTAVALRAYEKALAPGREAANLRLVAFLAKHGDRDTRELLTKLSRDERYSEPSRRAFDEALRRMAERTQKREPRRR